MSLLQRLRPYARLPLLMLAMTVLAMVLGTIALRFVEARLVATTGETLALAAADITDKLDRIFYERYGDLQMLASAPVLLKGDAAGMIEYLNGMKKAYPFYLWLGATDAEGRITTATDPRSVGKDRGGSEWFRAVRETGRVHVQDAEVSEDSRGMTSVSFTAPIVGAEGEFLGAVRASIELQALEDVFARTVYALEVQRGTTKVEWQFLARNGDVIVDSVLRQEGRVNLKQLGLPSALLSFTEEPGYVEEEHLRRHVPVITGYAQAKGYGEFTGIVWGVLVRMDRSDVLAPIRALMWKLGMTGAVAWVPMFVLLFWSVVRLREEWMSARENERKFTELVQESPSAIITLDPVGALRFYNAAAERLSGYTAQEMVGRRFTEIGIIAPESHARALQEFELALRGEKRPAFELDVITKDHRRLTGEVYPRLMHEGGRLTGVQVTIQDITERKRVEEERARLTKDLRLLLESTEEGIYGLDREGRCTFVNRAAARMLGYEPDELMGKSMHALMHHSRADGSPYPVAECPIHQVFQIGQGCRVFDEAFWRRDRTSFPADYASSLIIEDGGIKGAVVTFNDITERKRIEEAARASEERFRLAIDHANDAILYLDAKDIVLWANRRAEMITGRTIDALVGRSLMAVFSTQPMAKAQLASIGLGKPVPPVVEFEVFLKDGTSVWLEVTITHVRKDGEVVGWLLVARDRTERKHIERKLRQSEKLAALGTLLDGVAHELNNPLFMISGFAQLAGEKLKQRRYDDLEGDLASIQDAARRASGIVLRTLAVARSTATGRVPCRVNDLVQQTLDLVANDLRIHQIEVCTRLQEDLPLVLADPYDLGQVILNLITNARQAMVTAHGRGTLTITTALVPNRPRLWVEVRVADDGPGIAPEHRARVFEPFFTTRPVGQETGPGLSISHRVVTELGGTLSLESGEGQGATFIVRLPASEGSDA